MNLNKQILEAVNRGIQLALDDYEDIEPNSSISQSNDVIDAEDVIQNKIKLNELTVDLGLPSGTLWCKYNLGVNPNQLIKPEDWYGNYFAWGETIPNKSDGYNQETYQFGKDLIKYNEEDHLTKLQFMDDAAYQNMHVGNFKFRIPTKEQFEELIEETNNEWVKNFNNSGVNGYKFTSKLNPSKYIFMPAATFSVSSGVIGIKGCYWSSSLHTDYPYSAQSLYFDDEVVGMYGSYRFCGFSVRPVLMKNNNYEKL